MTRLTESQRTAACLMHLAAALAWARMDDCVTRDPETWWYAWCVEGMAAAADPFERAVWWALRGEWEEPEDDWLGYVEHVWSHAGWSR